MKDYIDILKRLYATNIFYSQKKENLNNIRTVAKVRFLMRRSGTLKKGLKPFTLQARMVKAV